jgi:tetratricopeptide (TPR) repeat protein
LNRCKILRSKNGHSVGIEAISLDPLDAQAHEFLGLVVYLPVGQLAEAEQSFRRALQIRPEFDVDHYFLGETLMLQGHLETALAEFRKTTPDDGQAVGSAMAHFAAGRKAESDAHLAEAIRQNRGDWPKGSPASMRFAEKKITPLNGPPHCFNKSVTGWGSCLS